ncbi:MAG: hypothetical protein HYT47_01135 [Candidatus Vogelbacteria bacterium]|nr:hypothetical protein [Candidatus Vogelbacteria bacterium]
MLTKLSNNLNTKIKLASKRLGVKKAELVNNAVTLYLDNLSPYLDLKNELAAWDKLANEALAAVERIS